MKTNLLKVSAVATVWLIAGCTSYESAQNTHLAREYLTEDLEDQIMFNLIRAYNGLPFLHYDVTSVQSIVTAKVFPQIGGGRTSGHNTYPGSSTSTVTTPRKALSTTVTTAVGAVSAATETLSRPFSYNLNGERDNALTVNIAPNFDEPVIEKYVGYLNLPNRLKDDKVSGDEAEDLGNR